MSTREPETTETRGIEFRCARCGHEALADSSNRQVTCPDCATTFGVRVAEGFAMLERDGWAVTVTLDVPGEATAGRRPD